MKSEVSVEKRNGSATWRGITRLVSDRVIRMEDRKVRFEVPNGMLLRKEC